MPDEYISPIFRPCCGNLWEQDHKPNCEQGREENLERDFDDWGRESTTLISEAHVDPQC